MCLNELLNLPRVKISRFCSGLGQGYTLGRSSNLVPGDVNGQGGMEEKEVENFMMMRNCCVTSVAGKCWENSLLTARCTFQFSLFPGHKSVTATYSICG